MKQSSLEYIKEVVLKHGYQDVECINFVGRTKSYLLWESIKDLVNWKNKTVVDLGSHFGYFSFKAVALEAKVIGLEKEQYKVDIANLISQDFSNKVKFKIWEDGQDIPKSEIILCLNVFHHFKNKELTLQKMNCDEAIFRVNKGNISLIKKYFKIKKEFQSEKLWKPNRKILLLERIK
jgi:2-polyprenyl-3-methyl-5-hydroxy-6-metoxy-1,4-benzoquinol methylase